MNLVNVEKLEVVNTTALHNGRSAKDVFCENWDKAKTALDVILLVTKSWIVKLVVTTVIAVGDKVQSKICNV